MNRNEPKELPDEFPVCISDRLRQQEEASGGAAPDVEVNVSLGTTAIIHSQRWIPDDRVALRRWLDCAAAR
jgi:hypothetical protein